MARVARCSRVTRPFFFATEKVNYLTFFIHFFYICKDYPLISFLLLIQVNSNKISSNLITANLYFVKYFQFKAFQCLSQLIELRRELKEIEHLLFLFVFQRLLFLAS